MDREDVDGNIMYDDLSFETYVGFIFFFNDTATTEIYTLSLHDALPIWKKSLWLFTLLWLVVSSYLTLSPSKI